MPESESKIRLRAYSIWEGENRPEGKHLEHWSRAKAEMEAEPVPAPEHGGAAPALSSPGAGSSEDLAGRMQDAAEAGGEAQ